jgi:hypothetical protein
MTDESKLLIAQDRGAKAEELMRNELLIEAFKTAEAAYILAIVKSEPSETDLRENCYTAIQILGDVQKHIKTAISNGKMARKELDDLANRRKPKAA